MRSPLALFSVALLFLSSACSWHHSYKHAGPDRYELARATLADGAVATTSVEATPGNTKVEYREERRRSDGGVESKREEVKLGEPVSEKLYAGFVLREVASEWTQKIFGQPRICVFIDSVELGSPAYLAGFRTGDLLEAVDGGPVEPAQAIARRIAERGTQHGSIEFAVSRGQSKYKGTIPLRDYSGQRTAYVPLIYCAEEGVVKSSWSVGPWGLIVRGKTTYVAYDWSRQPHTDDLFSALFGLVRVEKRPRETCTRLLWFIHFHG